MVPNPIETSPPVDVAVAPQSLVVCGPLDVPPPPPEPPYQPWLPGPVGVALLPSPSDPVVARRRHAPRLWPRRRRLRLEQLLVLSGCLFAFAVGPAPLAAPPARRRPTVADDRRRSTAKFRVARPGLQLTPESRRWLDEVSEPVHLPLLHEERPRTRADCVGQPRPCPWVSCRHHLFLEVNESSGALRLNRPGLQVDQLEETCALDVAEKVRQRGEQASLEEIARLLGVSQERIRQIERTAMQSLTESQAAADRMAAAKKL